MNQSQGIAVTSNGSAAGDEVRRLLSLDKCKQAVELAKENHKRLQTAESQQLLVDAYTARIAQFQAKGALEDARTLIKLVGDRFPQHRSTLVGLQVRTAAAQGKIDELVAPLIRPDVTPEVREAIESAIRRDLVDLPLLADCTTLAADHPLRTAASAIWKAFQAATAGPMTDEQTALPEVSRRSPLAGWKLFIRGLAAYYRNEDDACRKSLDAIPPDAAARRLASALLSLLDERPMTAPSGITAAIRQRVVGDDKALRSALNNLEESYSSRYLDDLSRAMRGAMQACNASRPDLIERLRQHISVRSMMEDVPADEVRRVMGPALKNAYYWRLAATGSEKMGSAFSAATYWERFLRHGVAEEMFAANGKEAAVIYLRLANLLAELPGFELAPVVNNPSRRISAIKEMYRAQPPEIAALAPTRDDAEFRRAMDTNWVFRRAAELWPDSQTFIKWRQWAEKSDVDEKQLQELAEVWRRTLPADPQAPLLLAKLAEGRKALTLALRHLTEAEAIDAMNPEVRKARLRLTLGTTFRHFKEKKPHLIEKDLAELEAMPAMREGDRPALLDVMRAGATALRPDGAAAAQAAMQALAERIGGDMAAMTMQTLVLNAKLATPQNWPEVHVSAAPEPLMAADTAARAYLLGQGLGIGAVYPPFWGSFITTALRERPCRVTSAHLLALGTSAATRGDGPQAYLAAGTGLESAAGIMAARFLLLRAQSLPAWAESRRNQCLRAAMELAGAANDAALIDTISTETTRFFSPRSQRATVHRLGDELIAEIIKSERAAATFPKNQLTADEYLVTIGDEPPKRSFGGGGFPFSMDEHFDDDDDDEDYDDEDEDEMPFFEPGAGGFPNGGPIGESPTLKALLDRFGEVSPQKLFADHPELAVKIFQEMGVDGVDPQMIQDMFSALGGFLPGGKGKKRKR